MGRWQFLVRQSANLDVYLFAGITGDLDPNHVDEEYCKKTPIGHRIAHGALIVGYMSTTSTLITQGFGRPMLSLGYDRIPIYQTCVHWRYGNRHLSD